MSLKQAIRRNAALRGALYAPLALRRRMLAWRQVPADKFVRNLGGLVVSDVTVRSREFEGDFEIGPNSHLLHSVLAHGSFEPELALLFQGLIKRDRDVIDVGANIGFYTVMAARHVGKGRVLAAEPTSAAFSRLRRNIDRNAVGDRVIAFNGACGPTEGDLDIKIVEGMEEYSSLGVMEHPSVAGMAFKTERVAVRPLDALVRDNGLRPAVMKIDVEGAEMMVLEGSLETLRDHRPVILSEFVRPLLERNGTSPEAIIALFDKAGYDVRDPFDPKLAPGSTDFGDILAVPRGKS